MRVQHRLVRLLAVGALALGLAAQGLVSISRVEAQQASQAGQTADKVELLFVQNALSGSFDGKTLTLKGVGPTLYFSDRPDRVTGHLRTAEFVGHWDKGPDSFAKKPPNATLSTFGDKGVNSVVVELTSPRVERNTLSYTVKVLDGRLPASFKEASLFIDVLGRWRMAAMGMAIGEARGMEMGAARAAPAPAPAPLPAAPRGGGPVTSPPAVNVPATGSSGVTDKQAAAVAKLKELKSLLNQGLITQSQYQADSQKLLNEIIE